MAVKNEIDCLGKMLIRAIEEETKSLRQTIPFCENGTDHIVNRIGANNNMIHDISIFASAR